MSKMCFDEFKDFFDDLVKSGKAEKIMDNFIDSLFEKYGINSD